MSFVTLQQRYDNMEPEEKELTKEDVLKAMTFSKKWELANSHYDCTDKDFRVALMQDLVNSHSVKDVIDFCKYTDNLEKYFDEVLIDNKLI